MSSRVSSAKISRMDRDRRTRPPQDGSSQSQSAWRWTLLIAIPIFGVLASPWLQEPPSTSGKPCHDNPQLVGACFRVHGALRYYNGGTPVRIWKIGTDHLLAVGVGPRRAVSGYCQLPKTLLDTLDAGKEIIADFVTCPFSLEHAGEMQFVCVDSAYNVGAKPYRF